MLGRVAEPNARLDSELADAKARLEVNPDDADADALMIRGSVLVARGCDEEAIRVLLRRRSLTRGDDGPDQLLANVLNRRARSLLLADPRSCSTQTSVELARQAVVLAPQARDYVNTLGIALCRAGRDAEVLPYLEDSLERGHGQTDAQDLYFPAIVHHRLGRAGEARTQLARAIHWHDRHGFVDKSLADELDRFRAEVQAILALPPSRSSGSDPVSRLRTPDLPPWRSLTPPAMRGG
jgi:tetratricopeptide (TPR) repeat protein